MREITVRSFISSCWNSALCLRVMHLLKWPFNMTLLQILNAPNFKLFCLLHLQINSVTLGQVPPCEIDSPGPKVSQPKITKPFWDLPDISLKHQQQQNNAAVHSLLSLIYQLHLGRRETITSGETYWGHRLFTQITRVQISVQKNGDIVEQALHPP